MLGFGEILVIAAAVVVFFSAKRLPDLARALRKSKGALKSGLEGEGEKRPVRDVTPKGEKGSQDPGK